MFIFPLMSQVLDRRNPKSIQLIICFVSTLRIQHVIANTKLVNIMCMQLNVFLSEQHMNVWECSCTVPWDNLFGSI